MEEKKKTTGIKSTEAAKIAYGFTKKMYRRGLEAKETGAPVAWVMWSNATVVSLIVEAMGLVAIYPENYGATCAAKRTAIPFLEASESEGFSPLLCGYCRNGIGFAHQMAEAGDIPADAPLGGMPKPVMLVGSSNACDTRFKFIQSLGRYLDVPCYCIDFPNPGLDTDLKEVTNYTIRYHVEELKGLVAFLERNLGMKMDMDRLSEMVDIGEKTRRLWYECYELRKAIPCPMPSQDMWTCMTPAFWLTWEKESLEFYKNLYDELKYRVDNKIGAVANEKYRLLFGELPPWHTLELFDYFASKGAVCVIESYWYHPGPPAEIPQGVTDPLERMTWWYYTYWTKSYDRAKKGCQPQGE